MVMKHKWFLVLALAMMVAAMTAGLPVLWQTGLAMAGTISLPRTGQTQCYDASGNVIACAGTGQDGALQMGAPLPTPRFTDNGNGTVTDNLTGLIWLKNANCFGAETWTDALTSANGLASGQCGLSDGSHAGDWRLPNDIELWSLIDFQYYNLALSNTAGTGQWTAGNPFTGVQSHLYWSGTTSAYNTDFAWVVGLWNGGAGWSSKDNNYYVWPVRGGQSGTFYNLTMPSIHLNANGWRNNNSFAVTVTSPVDVTYQITNAAPGQEAFFILDAPAVGINWSYLNSSYQWIPLPANLEQMTPCGYILGDGTYTLYQGPWPKGDYLIYLGFDNNKNGLLDFSSLTYDSLLIHVVK
ncbi:Lcl C-terminal domain-containing protein [Dissulfurimicrobium hydrothermale]|uniref:Lcl C-terminal domain-containing protein n=1 Tax=Dissulfurimicrobium hydrothermale TaxID=1750598 RepID=UPI001ED9CD58|nr:DUF1566 domain-containing protein [Dissulfurimicrobium hydrothermale]UKL13726.1 DUF1566 domain-containing protein [Dissulfurimicrobium hydrothermale]